MGTAASKSSGPSPAKSLASGADKLERPSPAYSRNSHEEEDSQSLSRSERDWDSGADPESEDAGGGCKSGARGGAARSELPYKKEVKVLKTFGARESDETNQTGQTVYEQQVIDRYYYTPLREKPGHVLREEEERRRRREERRRKKGAREERRGGLLRWRKGKTEEATQEIHPVEKALQMSLRTGVFTVARKDLDHLPEHLLEKISGTVRVIDIGYNRLSQIQPELCKYILVTRFSAAANLIEVVPPHFGKMTGLKKIDLSNNRIESLPDDLFRNMRELDEINLSDNRLTSLPSVFASNKVLRVCAARNHIESIPEEIAQMKWLMELDLSSNLIEVVPECMCANVQLRSLVLDDNKIASFPSSVLRLCKELRIISIRQNPISLDSLKRTDGFNDYIDRCLNSRPKLKPADSPNLLEEYVLADKITVSSSDQTNEMTTDDH